MGDSTVRRAIKFGISTAVAIVSYGYGLEVNLDRKSDGIQSLLELNLNRKSGFDIGIQRLNVSVGLPEASAVCGSGWGCSGSGGMCGMGMGCSGGGGMCGMGFGCSGGGGVCGIGSGCAGGGGKCGMANGCPGS